MRCAAGVKSEQAMTIYKFLCISFKLFNSVSKIHPEGKIIDKSFSHANLFVSRNLEYTPRAYFLRPITSIGYRKGVPSIKVGYHSVAWRILRCIDIYVIQTYEKTDYQSVGNEYHNYRFFTIALDGVVSILDYHALPLISLKK